jgi:hypothetical protein
MANDVFANGREVACKAADGKSICAFPDVCMTPPENPATPPGVPVPYPNTGFARDTTEGSRTVRISGKEVMLKNKSHFKTSTGDEAGAPPRRALSQHQPRQSLLHRLVRRREGRGRERVPPPRHDDPQPRLADGQ